MLSKATVTGTVGPELAPLPPCEQVDGDDGSGARAREHRSAATAAPDGRADRRGDRGDPDGSGLEDHLAEEDLARGGQAERALPPLDRGGRGRRVVVGLRQACSVAEGDEIGAQLTHIGAVRHADAKGPVGGHRTVQQRHRPIAHRVDGLVLFDDVAHAG